MNNYLGHGLVFFMFFLRADDVLMDMTKAVIGVPPPLLSFRRKELRHDAERDRRGVPLAGEGHLRHLRKLRGDATEDYNVIPNFFIIALYARNNPSQKAKWKADVRKMFREKIRSMLETRFDFCAMTPRADVDAEQFLRENFQLSLGKVYAPYGNGDAHSYYSLALDRDERFRDENDAVKGRLAQGFAIAPCPLGTDPATVVSGETAIATPPVPKRFLTHHWIENYLEKYFLVGCCKDAAHQGWILGRNKFKRSDLYNVRLGPRPGAVADAALTRSPKFLVLYDFAAPSSCAVYRIKGGMRCDKDKMVRMGYASAKCGYYCYTLEEEVSLGDLDVPRLLADRKREKGGAFTPGEPIYLKGGELIAYRR